MNRRDFLASLAVSPTVLSGSRREAPDFVQHAKLTRTFLQSAVDREGGNWLPYHRFTFKEKPFFQLI